MPARWLSRRTTLVLLVALALRPSGGLGAQVAIGVALGVSRSTAVPAGGRSTVANVMPQLSALLPAPSDPQPNDDRWFGADKVRHFGSCVAIQLIGYGMLRTAGAGRTASLVGATVLTATASVWKERQDARAGGRVSGRDLFWDGVGIIVGSGLIRFADTP